MAGLAGKGSWQEIAALMLVFCDINREENHPLQGTTGGGGGDEDVDDDEDESDDDEDENDDNLIPLYRYDDVGHGHLQFELDKSNATTWGELAATIHLEWSLDQNQQANPDIATHPRLCYPGHFARYFEYIGEVPVHEYDPHQDLWLNVQPNLNRIHVYHNQ